MVTKDELRGPLFLNNDSHAEIVFANTKQEPHENPHLGGHSIAGNPTDSWVGRFGVIGRPSKKSSYCVIKINIFDIRISGKLTTIV